MAVAIYPCKNMRITQGYTGSTSHLAHYKAGEWALDEGGKDTAKTEWFYAPFDLVVDRVYTAGTNTIFFHSQEKLMLPTGKEEHVCMLVTHPNSFGNLKAGSKVSAGTKLFQEGNDGASGYHFHFAVGLGTFKGNGWYKASTGAWVINCTGGSVPLEQVFYVDQTFTNVIDGRSAGKLLEWHYLTNVCKTTANLNLWETPNDGKVLCVVPKGAQLLYYGLNRDGWHCVQYGKDKFGYVSPKYITNFM